MDSSRTTKVWYKSKTVWFNILTIAAGISGGLGGILPALGPVVSATTYQWILFSVGVLGLSLRVVTNAPINWSDDVDQSDGKV